MSKIKAVDAKDAQVGDIVTSRWRHGGAHWRVTEVHEWRLWGRQTKRLYLVSLGSGRKGSRLVDDMTIVSTNAEEASA